MNAAGPPHLAPPTLPWTALPSLQMPQVLLQVIHAITCTLLTRDKWHRDSRRVTSYVASIVYIVPTVYQQCGSAGHIRGPDTAPYGLSDMSYLSCVV
jgi:hypothetical protein